MQVDPLGESTLNDLHVVQISVDNAACPILQLQRIDDIVDVDPDALSDTVAVRVCHLCAADALEDGAIPSPVSMQLLLA